MTVFRGRRFHVPAADRFGDLFHEIPEPETFYLPCGAEVSSFCSVKIGKARWTLDVIPRSATEAALDAACISPDLGFSFRIIEHAETDRALVLAEYDRIIGSIWLAYIDPATVPRA